MINADVSRLHDAFMWFLSILGQLSLAVGAMQGRRQWWSTAVSLLLVAGPGVAEVEIRATRVASAAAGAQALAVTGDDGFELSGLQIAHEALEKWYASCDNAEVHYKSIQGENFVSTAPISICRIGYVFGQKKEGQSQMDPLRRRGDWEKLKVVGLIDSLLADARVDVLPWKIKVSRYLRG